MIEAAIITLAAIATSFLLSYLLERFGKRQRMREIQQKIKEINKAYSEAVKRKDAIKIKALEKEMESFPKLMIESVVLSLWSMAIILPVFYIATIAITSAFPAFSIELPFSLPVPVLSQEEFVTFRNTFGPRGWFIVSLILIAGPIQLLYTKLIKR